MASARGYHSMNLPPMPSPHHAHDSDDGHCHGHASAHGHRSGARGGSAVGTRGLRVALALSGAFLVAEVVGGLLANSLALLADAGHLLTDVAALGFPPVIESRVHIDPQALADVRDAMADVVNAPNGTAHGARLANIIVAGKTGTAQVVKEAQGVRVKENVGPEQNRDHAWFIAFAPKDHPQIAIACIIEHGGHGGSSAGPVVKAVMEKYFAMNPPQGPSPGQLTQNATVKPAAAPAQALDAQTE